MTDHILTIRSITAVTHNVRRIVADKPAGYDFHPGQATTIALEKTGWRDEQRPFSFTSLPHERMLEWTIKIYHSHDGVTDRMDDLTIGDRLRISDAFGAITDHGPGTFIAGGAGITPFLAILRHQAQTRTIGGSRLLFSNKQQRDVICQGELVRYLGEDAVFTLTQERAPFFEHGRIDEDFLEHHVRDWDAPFYLCGPPAMASDLQAVLERKDVAAGELVLEG
jgi:ferredoxin-NADP reductase